MIACNKWEFRIDSIPEEALNFEIIGRLHREQVEMFVRVRWVINWFGIWDSCWVGCASNLIRRRSDCELRKMPFTPQLKCSRRKVQHLSRSQGTKPKEAKCPNRYPEMTCKSTRMHHFSSTTATCRHHYEMNDGEKSWNSFRIRPKVMLLVPRMLFDDWLSRVTWSVPTQFLTSQFALGVTLVFLKSPCAVVASKWVAYLF